MKLNINFVKKNIVELIITNNNNIIHKSVHKTIKEAYQYGNRIMKKN